MDKTEIYVKMCREAKEIQEIKCKDYSSGLGFSLNYLGEKDFWSKDKKGRIVFLSRQDQLQEMLVGQDVNQMITGISHFHDNHSAQMELKKWSLFGSMEQLWLAFVMSERFGKRWTGETWEKI